MIACTINGNPDASVSSPMAICGSGCWGRWPRPWRSPQPVGTGPTRTTLTGGMSTIDFMSDITVERLLTPGEVAALFRVDPKTVTRWAKQGRLPSLRTLGGHRRFRWSDIEPHLSAVQ